jgi:hypothetical protein
MVGVGPYLKAQGGRGQEGDEQLDSAKGEGLDRRPFPAQVHPNRHGDGHGK